MCKKFVESWINTKWLRPEIPNDWYDWSWTGLQLLDNFLISVLKMDIFWSDRVGGWRNNFLLEIYLLIFHEVGNVSSYLIRTRMLFDPLLLYYRYLSCPSLRVSLESKWGYRKLDLVFRVGNRNTVLSQITINFLKPNNWWSFISSCRNSKWKILAYNKLISYSNYSPFFLYSNWLEFREDMNTTWNFFSVSHFIWRSSSYFIWNIYLFWIIRGFGPKPWMPSF